MTIQEDGNVGIGTSDPDALLEVYYDANSWAQICSSNHGAWGEGSTMVGRFADTTPGARTYVAWGNWGINTFRPRDHKR